MSPRWFCDLLTLRSQQQEDWQAGFMPSALSLCHRNNAACAIDLSLHLNAPTHTHTQTDSPSAHSDNVKLAQLKESPLMYKASYKISFYIFVVSLKTKRKQRKYNDSLAKINLHSGFAHLKLLYMTLGVVITLMHSCRTSLLQCYLFP